MTDPGPLALLAWLLPAGAFVLLAVAVPLRRSGKASGWVSVLVAAGALWAAFSAWRAVRPGEHARLLWEWLPMATGPLATGMVTLPELDQILSTFASPERVKTLVEI